MKKIGKGSSSFGKQRPKREIASNGLWRYPWTAL